MRRHAASACAIDDTRIPYAFATAGHRRQDGMQRPVSQSETVG